MSTPKLVTVAMSLLAVVGLGGQAFADTFSVSSAADVGDFAAGSDTGNSRQLGGAIDIGGDVAGDQEGNGVERASGDAGDGCSTMVETDPASDAVRLIGEGTGVGNGLTAL